MELRRSLLFSLFYKDIARMELIEERSIPLKFLGFLSHYPPLLNNLRPSGPKYL
jgi:hypothetical protein